MWNHARAGALVFLAFAAACGGSGGSPGADGGAPVPDGGAGGALVDTVSAARAGTIEPGFIAASIAALDEDTVVVARGDVSGDAFCPDCLDIEPSECPALCERTELTVAVLDASTGELGEPFSIGEVFPAGFDHDVSQIDLAPIDPTHVAVAWLECDNSTCGGLFSKQSCTARYAVVDLEARAIGPVATLYGDRFGWIQLVAHPSLDQVLAVTGRSWGSYGAGVRAAIFDRAGTPLLDWVALGGVDATSPAATAIADGFAVVAEDRRPADLPPDQPCAASCECAGTIAIDPGTGGLYVHELTVTGGVATDLVSIGLMQDGHLAGGHYHDRQVLSVVARDDELVIAGGQSIENDAELFVGRGSAWAEPVVFDSPIPLWIGALAGGDHMAWIGSQPEQGQPATVNRIVAGVSDGAAHEHGPITEPTDSYVFEVAPVITPNGVTTAFLLRGMFVRDENGTEWGEFEIVKVEAGW